MQSEVDSFLSMIQILSIKLNFSTSCLYINNIRQLYQQYILY